MIASRRFPKSRAFRSARRWTPASPMARTRASSASATKRDLILRARQDPTLIWNGRFTASLCERAPRPLQSHTRRCDSGGGSIEPGAGARARLCLLYLLLRLQERRSHDALGRMQRPGGTRIPIAPASQFVGVAESARGAGVFHRGGGSTSRPLPTSIRASRRRQAASRSDAACACALGGRRRGGALPRARAPRRRLRGDHRRYRLRMSAPGPVAEQLRRCELNVAPDAVAAVRQHESPAPSTTRALSEGSAAAARGSVRRRVGGTLVAASAALRGRDRARFAHEPAGRATRCYGWAVAGRGSRRAAPLGFLGGLRGLPRWPAFLALPSADTPRVAPWLRDFPARRASTSPTTSRLVSATLDLLEASGPGADPVGARSARRSPRSRPSRAARCGAWC
jgi:hypothetical protein